MPDFAPSVTRLIDELKRLPGIGQKTAQRLAFYLLRVNRDQAFALSDAIREAKEKVRECSICNNITDADPCLFCSSTTRSKATICVVEEATNIQAVEKTRQFNGLYHVLGGALSPLQGVGPDQLRIKSLIERMKGGAVEEIIIATNRGTPVIDIDGSETGAAFRRIVQRILGNSVPIPSFQAPEGFMSRLKTTLGLQKS